MNRAVSVHFIGFIGRDQRHESSPAGHCSRNGYGRPARTAASCVVKAKFHCTILVADRFARLVADLLARC